MSLATQLLDLATRIATEVKSIRTLVNGNAADLSSLTTTAKGNLVAAINELKASISGAAGIDDGVTGTSTTWSSDKIVDELDELAIAIKNDILGGASAAYDTLQELATILQTQGGDLTSFTTALGNRVRFDAAQSLDNTQKTQARTNIGAASAADMGDPATNFVTTFEAGLT